MKPWETMTEDEKDAFQDLVVRASRVMTVADECAPFERRPAMLALWVICHDRSVTNVHTQYDIDPWATVEDAVRQTVLLMENLMCVIVEDEPAPAVKQESYRAIAKTISMLRDPKYRSVIADELQDFFQDQREQGHL